MLSILIPCYNDPCCELVSAIIDNVESCNIEYEILVGDDGSTREDIKEQNREINNHACCRYIEREENVGRSAIRNFLGREARYENLLFMDCEVRFAEGLIRRYLDAKDMASVVCGGLMAEGDGQLLRNNLRFIYEKNSEDSFSYMNRARHPYQSFRTANFLIKKDVFLNILFDENIKTYGYEDVIFGKTLKQKGIEIAHIDNSVVMYNYEDNLRFVEKTEEAMRTLRSLSAELEGYSSILTIEDKLSQYHLLGFSRWLFGKVNGRLRRNITGESPNLLAYKLYKVGYYITLQK